MEQANVTSGRRIAIIEDDADIRQMLQTLLELEGYAVFPWSEASQAYTKIQQTRPALLLLDVWLEAPDSGWRLLDELHYDAKTHALPVIVYSAHAFMLGEMAVMHREPHYVFLHKPLQPPILLHTIATLLEHKTALA